MSSSFLRNRIINGDMRVDQRNAGASVTPTNGQFSVDRWFYQVTQASKLTAQQSSTSATGFSNSILTTSSSAYSIVAADAFNLVQSIEGLNTADLSWGTASAQTITISFWVRSSLTGTFGGCVTNSALNRSYPFTYTILSANTFEQKTITIAGDTSGTWLTTNGVGLRVYFGLGVGSTYSGTAGAWAGANYFSATGATSVVGTSGATFYVTGVQLEVGTVATPFERQIYNAQLAQCQRYFCKSYDQATVPGTATFVGAAATSTYATAFNGNGTLNFIFPVEMRSAPTVTIYSSINANTTGKCSSTTVDYNTNGASANTRQAYSSATSSGGAASQLFYQWTAAIEL